MFKNLTKTLLKLFMLFENLMSTKNETNMADYEKAQLAAEEVIKKNYILSAPINPFELAKNYNVRIFMSVFEEEDVAGYYNKSEGKIHINAKDPIYRQSFTLAHELGHLILDHELPKGFEVLYRRALGDYVNEPIEQEANTFAANLLVPLELLHAKLETLSKEDENTKIEILSEYFAVSKQVIGYRLKWLQKHPIQDPLL
jgi:Zn-dependent peptidase ImmA (M78 family)